MVYLSQEEQGGVELGVGVGLVNGLDVGVGVTVDVGVGVTVGEGVGVGDGGIPKHIVTPATISVLDTPE
jgi:hypothetical protein